MHEETETIYKDDISFPDILDAAMSTGTYCIQPQANDGKAKNLVPRVFYWWGNALDHLWNWSHRDGIKDLLISKECIDYLIEAVKDSIQE